MVLNLPFEVITTFIIILSLSLLLFEHDSALFFSPVTNFDYLLDWQNFIDALLNCVIIDNFIIPCRLSLMGSLDLFISSLPRLCFVV